MHTAETLRPHDFTFTTSGGERPWAEPLPDYAPFDRFGIVMSEPLGALGASLLIHLATCAFFEADPRRRGSVPQYPEIYVFHVGGPWGDLSSFDFWPPRKEVTLDRDGESILASINDRGITRLAVPDGPMGRVEDLVGATSWADISAATARLSTCIAYGPNGSVSAPDLTISTTNPVLEGDVEASLNPLAGQQALAAMPEEVKMQYLPGPTTLQDMSRWGDVVRSRGEELTPAERSAARARLTGRVDGQTVTETYRRLTVDQALELLSGLVATPVNPRKHPSPQAH